MEEVGNQAADTAGRTLGDVLTVFFSWVFTPTGAILTLLMIIICAGSIVFAILQKSTRALMTALTICAFLLFVWIITGVLEVMGLPVREWMKDIAAQMPDIGSLFMEFLRKLVFTATE